MARKTKKKTTVVDAPALTCDYVPVVRKKSLAYFFVKRGFDIFNSLLLILLLSPILLILTICAAISSRGAPIFKDVRLGKDGKTIKVYKYRSMFRDAETNPQKYLNEEQMQQWMRERKVEDDPRITRFGRFVRKTSLDELPQLFNILFGTLSFVGPRPIVQRELDGAFYPEQQKILLSARPGMIGNWDVNGRSKVTFASGQRQYLELDYFAKRSLWFDFKLLLKVIPAVLKHDGAQ